MYVSQDKRFEFSADILIDGERRFIAGYNTLNNLSILLVVFEYAYLCITLVVIIQKPIFRHQLVLSFAGNS